MRYQIGFVGAGHMAEAMARAAIERAGYAADRIAAADPSSDRRTVFAGLGAAASASNEEVIRNSERVVIAVKPQALEKVAADLAQIDGASQIAISVMAGVGTEKIERAAGKALRVVRVMPNTPVLAGAGMAAVAAGAHARPGDTSPALELFRAAGDAIEVDESALDAVTAVSGSGPAYTFYLAEAMERAAHELGLSPEDAQRLVKQTIAGAAALLTQSDEGAGRLREKVASPGGTTEAALSALDGAGVAEAVIEAMRAADRRSRELGG